MGETGIGFFAGRFQSTPGDARTNERSGDARHHLSIGHSSEVADLLGADLRPVLGQVEPAVPGKTRQQHLVEVEDRGGASRGDIFHV